MQILGEPLPSTYLIQLPCHRDLRGSFVKTFAASAFSQLGLTLDLREEFYSISAQNVLRGMHFQLPPHHHVKMVYCPVGAVHDVLLDLREGPSYGQSIEVVLDAQNPTALLIPPGIAHGFLALQPNSLMVYKTSTEYAPNADSGIRWDSFGHDWKLHRPPVMSERDSRHPAFSEFQSPF